MRSNMLATCFRPDYLSVKIANECMGLCENLMTGKFGMARSGAGIRQHDRKDGKHKYLTA